MSDNSAASNLPAFTPMTLNSLSDSELFPMAASVIEETETYRFAGLVYPDPVKGFDIGYGLQLNPTNMPYIVAAMVNLPVSDDDVSFLSLELDSAMSGLTTASAVQNALNSVMQGYSGTNFVLSLGQAKTALTSVLANVTSPALDEALEAVGGFSLTYLLGGAYQEYVALLDLYYAGGTKLVGPTSQLVTALVDGNRAQAWFEIRYGSNGNQLGGIAKRRYYDSQIFGLFSDPSNPSLGEVVQAYEMLTANRSAIIQYEAQYGVDPDGGGVANPNDSLNNAGRDYGTPVQTLAESFTGAFQVLLGMVAEDSPLLANITSSFATDTNIFVASSGSATVDASLGDPATNVGVHIPNQPALSAEESAALNAELTSDDALEADANHILIGTGNAETLIGGLGDDVLIAGGGSETLHAGDESDTIVAGSGNDLVVLGGVSDVVDFEFGTGTGLTEVVEVNAFNGVGTLDVGGSSIDTGLTFTGQNASGDDTWTGGGNTYTFNPNPANPPLGYAPQQNGDDIGLLSIQTESRNTINVWGFDLTAGDLSTGYLGIHTPESVSLAFGSVATGNPPDPAFTAGTTQSYTVSVDASSETSQTVTVTLTGAPASDFGLIAGTTIVPLNSDGTFTVTIPAGNTSVSFSLVNTADVGSGATLQLTASMADPNAQNDTVSSSPLTQSYVEPAADPFSTPVAPQLYYYGQETLSSGVSVGNYLDINTGAGDTPVASVGDGSEYIGLAGAGGESINGGSGSDTVAGGFGGGGGTGQLSVINGDGGQDLIDVGNAESDVSSVGIYANSEEDLSQAIDNANSGAATNVQGDLISAYATAGNVTVVGGNGNDLLMTASDGEVVAGPGSDTIVGGGSLYTTGTLVGTSWSASASGNQLTLGDGLSLLSPSGAAYSAYEGSLDSFGYALGDSNDTIFGGAGNDVILLSNGNNEVNLGNGDSTVYGGMGSSTIFGGAGNDSIIGGGGNDYIELGGGSDLIAGRGGNNTIIGGSGADTIFAGGSGSDWVSQETGNNYAQAGTGNSLIDGSGGNDTLIGGSGSDTIQAGDGNESIVAGSGNTSINGGSGTDTIAAGSGSDTIWSSTQAATIYGGSGTDEIYGRGGTDVIYAGDGGTSKAATVVNAGSGNTTIYGGDGIDQISGGSGEDVIYAGDGGTSNVATQVVAGSGDTTVYGGGGVDEIFGGSGTDVLYAGDGGTNGSPSYVMGGPGVATLYGGAGASVLTDNLSGSDVLEAGSGDSTLNGVGQDTLIAGSGDDYLAGGPNSTYIFGSNSGVDQVADDGTETIEFASSASGDLSLSAVLDSSGVGSLEINDGDDFITLDGALGGANIASVDFQGSQSMSFAQLIQEEASDGSATALTVAGSEGNFIFDVGTADALTGGSGVDTMSAWGDNDTLSAGSGGAEILAEGTDDLVTGSSASDTLDAAAAGTTLVGGSGNEVFEVSDPTDVVEAQADANSNQIYSSASYTLPINVDILTLTGTADLSATGNSDAGDFISGNAGDDTLIAGSGSDSLAGGSGNDTLVAGSGTDLLQGATGNTSYVFDSGFGQAEIQPGGGNGTIEFGAGITLSDLTVGLTTDSSGNPALLIEDGSGSITVDGGLTGSAGTFSFADGTHLSLAEFLASATVLSGSLAGGSGNTILETSSAVSLSGGSGQDTIFAWGGNDTLSAGSGGAEIFAEGTDDVVTGSSANDTLDAGGAGTTLVGGSGNEVFEVNDATDVVEAQADAESNQIYSSVSYTLPTNGDVLTLTGTDNLSATGNGDAGNLITGNGGDDTLTAGSGGDTLIAGSGTDTLVAGSGTDLLEGSAGSTTYLFDSGAGPAEIEPGTGDGTIEFGAGITPSDLTVGLATDSNGNPALLIQDDSASITVEGGLTGSIGTFDFADGAQLSLVGLFGAAAVASESLAGASGNAILETSSGVSLSGGAGEDTIFAWGNNDTLSAGSEGAAIFAEGADDLVTGSSANDTLDAAAAGATLVGGSGNEVFEISDATDVVQAQASAASNQIYSSVSYTLPTAVNALTLTGTANLSAIGNSDAGNLITGNAGEDTLTAGSGSDTLDSGSGIDTLVGGGGLDTFVVNNSGDVVEPNIFSEAQDTIESSVDYDLSAPVGALNLTGSADLYAEDDDGYATITGNQGDDTLAGGAGSDTLVAGSGVDTFDTGTGDNTFVINNTNDVIDLTTGWGNDTVDSSVTYVLTDPLVALNLTGSADLSATDDYGYATLTGNEASDTLIGGSGSDTLVAGAGVDTLEAGTGNNTFVINNAGDVIETGDAPGDDTVESSLSYTLGQGLDTLLLTGSGNLEGAGNADASDLLEANSGNDTLIAGTGSDTLTAGSGSDSLAGGSGHDELIGGSGADTLVAGTGTDTLVAGSGANTFVINNVNDVIQLDGQTGNSTVESSVSYTLGAGLDTLDLTGSGNLDGQGNTDASNLLEANSGNDTLIAGSGSDMVIGGSGSDTLAAGSGSDTLVAGSGSNTLVGGSGDDTLVAGSGSDVLQGGTGNTTYLLDSGFGQADIYDPGLGTGVVQFGSGISPSDLTVGLTTDLVGNPALLIQDGNSSVTVGGALGGSTTEFEFAGGTQLNLAGLLASATDESESVTGSNGDAILDTSDSASLSGSWNDTILGTGASDTLGAGAGDEYLLATGDEASVSGGFGADTLVGAGANDTVEAGNGNQQLYGLGASDVLIGGIGDDTLYGGTGPDTLIAGTGNTVMYGSSAGDSIVLSAGGTVTLNPSSTSASELIELPAGMTLADFTAYEGANGSLILQSPSDGTTAVINGFYSDGSSGTLWMIANSGGQAQLLSDWLDSLQLQSNSSYAQEISNLEGSFAASLEGTLNQIGQQGGTIDEPELTYATDPGYQYQFNGVTTQNVTVQGGTLTVGNSDDYQSTSTTLQTGSTSELVGVPVYSEVTIPGWQEFIPDSSLTQAEIDNLDNLPSENNGQGISIEPGTNSDGVAGYTVTSLPYTESEETGTQTTVETVPEYTTSTQVTQSLTDYNITGDGGNDVITSSGPFVGTVVTENGNVSVDLGMANDPSIGGHVSYDYPNPLPVGAFIEAGSGMDTIVGTGGADVIAAGTGIDYIDAGLGSTVYAPLQGASTEEIATEAPYYGGGPLPQSTLVLPEGVTPQDLSYRLIDDWNFNADPLFNAIAGEEGPENWPTEVLQITYGDSSVLVEFNSGESGPVHGSPGISQFQFADGTMLTRNQLLAMAGTAISASTLNPTVTPAGTSIDANATVQGSSLFSGSDSSGLPITWYQVSNTGTNGGYFELNGVAQAAGQSFYVSADQLSTLTYVSGAAGTSDDISVSGFDGVVWGSTNSFGVNVASSSLYEATGSDQEVLGGSSGPDTLVGGYSGDTLVGGSGQDTFEYNASSGPEVISETASSSQTSDNVLQFGSGITPASISLSATGDPELVLSTGNGSDSIAIEGFNVLNPLQSFPIQSFVFADGENLGPLQLLEDTAATGSSGNIENADGSTTSYQFTPSDLQIYYAQNVNSEGQTTATVSLNSDGSQTTNSYAYNADGSMTQTEVVTPAGGGTPTTTVIDFNSQGQGTSIDITYPDGSTDDSAYTYNGSGPYTEETDVKTPAGGGAPTTTVTDFNSQGQGTSIDITYPDGSTDDSTYTYNADGSYTENDVQTPAGGGGSTTTVTDFNSQGQGTSVDITYPDGSTNDATAVYNADGSYTETDVTTPAGGGASTTRVTAFDSQGRGTLVDFTYPDGSTDDSSYAYNADGSYTKTEVVTPYGGTPTTTVSDYTAQESELSSNTYTLNADGSYTDTWSKADGSYGTYWWNASTSTYEDTWNDSNGSSWTDEYQYATGGSPGASGYSFLETYNASDGSEGSRQYDATTGAITLSWDSASTGELSGSITDSGFVGLQNDGELTNAQEDLSFFNPNVSSSFNAFLEAH
jgi:Ca2+-binding RTX toxin-like protein